MHEKKSRVRNQLLCNQPRLQDFCFIKAFKYKSKICCTFGLQFNIGLIKVFFKG